MDQGDIWRAAHQMVRRYKDAAAMEAATRSNAALNDGDQGGYEIWQQIMNAINELQLSIPRNGKAVH